MSCCKCLLITQEDFYKYVPLTQNVSYDSLFIAINNAQDKYINNLLCQELFDVLCAEYAAGTLNELNAQLVCLIQKAHVMFAFADFLFFHPIIVTKESVVRKFSDESEFVDFDTNEKQQRYWIAQAEIIVGQIRAFIKLHSDIPLYSESCTDCERPINDRVAGWGIS